MPIRMRPIASKLKRKAEMVAGGRKARRHAMVGPPRLWRMKRDFQIDYLRREGLQGDHTLLDLGCGTLRGGVPLIRYLEAGHYYGVEVRPESIGEAHSELADARLSHKAPSIILCNNMAALRLGVAFDYVWAFSVLIHMDDANLKAAFECVETNLGLDGTFLANVNLGEPAADREWQGFPIVWRREEEYEKLAEDHGLRMEAVGPLADLGHHTGTKQDTQVMLRFRRK